MKNIFVFFFTILGLFFQCQNYSILKKDVYQSPKNTLPKIKKEILAAEKKNNIQLISKLEYLNSFAYYLLEKSDSCIIHAQIAIETAKKINYPEGQALGLRMLGTQYAQLGFLDKSKANLDQGLDLMKNKDGDEANEINGLLWNSYIFVIDSNQKYSKKERFEFANKPIEYYQKIKNTELRKERLIAAYLNIGHLYNKEKDYKKGLFYMNEALQNVSQENSYMLVSVYYNLGETNVALKNSTEAINNLDKALVYSEKYAIDTHKKDIYYSLSKAYDQLNNKEKAYFFLEEYNKINDNIASLDKKTINTIDTEKKKQIPSQKNKNFWLWIGLGAFTVAGLSLFIFRKRKNQIIKSEIPEPYTEKIYDLKINTNTEQNILNMLEIFEQKKEYTSPSVTLYFLANKFHCNTKYLSATIKKFKNKSFSQYINDLRLDYIIKELQNNPKTRNYKISHLAEMAGFASHAAFTTAFIAFTTQKPSVYIKNLSE